MRIFACGYRSIRACSMHRRTALWALALAALLAGCVNAPNGAEAIHSSPPPEKEIAVPMVVEVPAPEDMRQLTELVIYAQRVAHMSADEQKREYTTANQAYTRDKSAYARVRLGLLLSLPGVAVQDDARAVALLEPYANSSQGNAQNHGVLRQFAALLHADLIERMRSQRRADQLKDQLEALRAVERSIIDRGLESQPRKP